MSSFSVIIDTQALVYLTRLGHTHDIWTILPNLFHEILVPIEIETEFIKGANKEPERLALVDEIDRGLFIKKCTSYDSGTLLLLQSTPKVDAGEAEAAAQQMIVNTDFIWSDDKSFRATVEKLIPNIIIYNSLHIISLLDVHGFIENYPLLIKDLHLVRPIKQASFKHCYKEVCRHLGYKISENEVHAKTDLKAMGII